MGVWSTNWRTIIRRKFSHYCESFRAHNRLPNLGNLAKGLGIPRESDSEAQQDLITELPQDWGNRDFWIAQTKSCSQKDPGERSNDPTRDWSRLPVSVWESLAEAWVESGLPQGQGHWQQQSWEVQHANISPLEGGHHYLYPRAYSLAIETADSRSGPPQAKF